MNPFSFLTRVFIDVFGITHPTPQQERRATWFISGTLGLIAVAAIVLFFLLHGLSQR